MGRTISDVTVEHDECRAAGRLLEYPERVFNAIYIIGIADTQDIPTIGEEARSDIFREGNASVAFNRDVVVVPDPTETVEFQVARKRSGLGRYAFHHATVATHCIDFVVKNVESRLVIASSQPLLRDCHAYTCGHPLSQRTRRRLDARDPVIFGMSRSFAGELPEATDVIERYRWLPEPLVIGVHGLYTREVQDRPQQHRGMSVR